MHSYAGIMPKQWAINSAGMVLYGFAIAVLCWGLWAYKVAFGEYMLPFAGRPGPVVTITTQLSQSSFPASSLSQDVPLSSMVYYQFVFAAIAITIVLGGFLGRINWPAWMVFIPLWISFSYSIGAFSLWGGGFLFQMGVIDCSGGYVIHLSSGIAGFVGSWWIGPRYRVEEDSKPSNLLFALTGASILWVGWNGCARGYPHSVSADTGLAIMNTNLCAAMSVLCWTIYDWMYFRNISILGAAQGLIAGLVAASSGAGVVAGWSAIFIGFLSSTLTWLSMILKPRTIFKCVDDPVGVFHTRCVAALVGGFCTGIFATVEGCTAFGLTNLGGAIDGNGRQVWLQ
jgi:Amt family ammonium transporter